MTHKKIVVHHVVSDKANIEGKQKSGRQLKRYKYHSLQKNIENRLFQPNIFPKFQLATKREKAYLNSRNENAKTQPKTKTNITEEYIVHV